MGDLISRSELLEEFEWLKMTVGSGSVGSIEDAIERIMKAPPVDTVEVVRCGGCAYYGKSPLGHKTLGWCRIDAKHRNPMFYCANADPKEV